MLTGGTAILVILVLGDIIHMAVNLTEIKLKGKSIKVPSIHIDDKTVIVTGKFIKIAAVHDEEWLENQVVNNPEFFKIKLIQEKLKADIFTFNQKITDPEPHYKYHIEWDNAAAITISSYQNWWDNELPQVTRKSIRRGAKRGVIAKVIEFNDELVNGIIEIHHDTPIRQGVSFAHYGKDFNTVKKEYGTYLDRSEFIGAYLENELIGIIKLVYMGGIASIMQIITKPSHYDKRPTNILIAKAVEICESNKIIFFVYGKYVYGNKTNSSLTEFKRRNGFKKVTYPSYYIPLTQKGRIALRFKLHLGLLGILPAGLITFLRNLRTKYTKIKVILYKPSVMFQNQNQSIGHINMDGGDE
jgi:hypothetical protein